MQLCTTGFYQCAQHCSLNSKKKFILASDVCNLLQNMIDLELNNKDQDLGNLGMCIVLSEVIFI